MLDESLLNTSFLNFSSSAILAGLTFGLIGMWMLKQGRKRGNLILVAIATSLMIYPLFTTGPWSDWGIGLLLCGVAYLNWNK